MGIRNIIFTFFILTSVLSIKAQVHLYVDDVDGGVGNQIIVPVRADNFTNLISMQGSIHFDPTVVSYTAVEQLGVPGLSVGNFGTTQASSGTVTFSWFDGNLSGESVSNGSVIFALRFTIIGSPSENSLVWLNDSPTLLEFVDNGFTTLTHSTDSGLITVTGQPGNLGLTLFGDSIVANQNDTVVIPIRVKEFNSIIGVQGTIGFDQNVADYISVEQYGVPGMTTSNFGTTQVNSGKLTFSWNSATTSGVTLADSSILFAVKYHVIGNGGSHTNISFLGAPTPMEIVDSSLTVLNPYLAGGYLEVQPDTNEIFSLLIDSVVGMQTQLVNVPVRAWAFNDIISMQGTFAFDTSVINYSSVVNFGLPDLSLSNFGTTQVNNGLLSFSWFDQDLMGETYADSAILFELVFDIHGDIGDFGEVLLNSDLTPIEFVELGNLPIAYVLDSGGVLVDSLGAFITIQNPATLTYCAGDSIGVVFETNVAISSGNIYTLELSDASGSFVAPDTLGTLVSTSDSTLISGIIPSGTPFGTGYKIRVNSSLPSFYGTETSVDLTIEYYEDSVATQICFGDSLFVGGMWQVNAGFYIDTLATINGCDSVIVTNLSFTNAFIDSVYLDICQGDSLMLEGAWQSTTGWYVDTLSSQQGCDSLIRTNLTVNSIYNTPVTQSICVGDSIFLEGAWQNSIGTYVDSLVSVNGCDSLVSTTLSFFPSDTVNVTQEICAGDSLFLGGGWQNASGSFSDIYPSIFGCDSTVITDLTVLLPIETSDTISVCYGDSLFTGGNWQVLSGNYVDSLIAVNGCDSLVLTHLIVKNAIVTTLYPSICAGDSLFTEGAWQLLSGTYTDTLTAFDGCDSLVINELTVVNEITSLDSLKICAGDSVMIHGVYQSLPGIYIDIFVSHAGCDSIASFSLSIETHPIYNDTRQICTGDSLFLEGAWQLSSGIYMDTLASTLGCDSIIQTNLNVINSIQNLINTQICSGDSLFLEGSWQQTSGIYNDTLQAAAGCDSIISTTLTVLFPTAGFDTLTICSGDSVLIDGNYQSVAGNYPNVLVGANGCDSIVDVLLIVNPTYFVQDAISICQGDSVYLEGAYQLTSGIYLDTNISVTGCDSILETTLTVNLIPIFHDTLSVCSGDSLLVNGNYLSSDGDYLDTLQAMNGCDSLIYTNFTVLAPIQMFVNAEICAGDSLFLEGNWQQTAGVYTDTLPTVVMSCDSIINTTLIILQPSAGFDTLTICSGDSVLIDGIYQSIAGNYPNVLVANNGCDSIVDVLLVVNPTYFAQDAISICQGDSIYLQGSYQLTSGVYLDTNVSVMGCDSILETTLTVNPSYFIQDVISICQGDSVLLEGAYQLTSGVYLDTSTTVMGCDSIIETTLTVNPAPVTFDTQTICNGDSVLVNGNYLSIAGSYTDTLQTASGCDSLVTTTLNVTTIDPSVTDNSPTLMANYGSAQSYQWINCDSGNNIANGTSQNYTAIANGSYQVLISDQGCEVYSICYTVNNVSITENDKNFVHLFPNPTSDKVTITHHVKDLQMYLFDIYGKELESRQVDTKFEVSLVNYPEGVYLLLLGGNTYKLIKQ